MTPRSLVGMTMGARKRAWLAGRIDAIVFPDGINTDELEMKSAYSWPEICRWWQPFGWQLLGQRLRPCPGCPSCTDSPRLQVIGYVRRIGGRVRIDRTLDVSGQSAFYVIMFSWRHEGPMQRLRGFDTKQLAWEHLQEYWGYRGHLPRLCDGSGVLPARAKKVRR